MKAPTRVLFLSAHYPPTVCGVGDYTARLSRELVCRGHQVAVVTSSGETVQSTPAVEVFPIVDSWRADEHVLEELVARWRPDVMVLQYVPNAFGLGGVALYLPGLLSRLKRRAHCSLIIVMHEMFYNWEINPAYLLCGICQRLQLRCLLQIADRVVVTTQHREQWLGSHFPHLSDRLMRIPVGANIEPSQTRLVLPQGERRQLQLVTFGSLLHRLRDWKTLFEAMAGCPRATLECIGFIDKNHGAWKEIQRWQEQYCLQGRVSWEGFLCAGELSNRLSRADAYVHITRPLGPSGRHTTIISAMAHGLPVVVTDGEEADSVFRNGAFEFIVKPYCKASLSAVLQELVEQPESRVRAARKAHDLFAREYSWERIVDTWIELLASSGKI